ncbi:MAG: NfeD family protein [Rhodoferax sp.]|jgi:membrane protein implicated in regulation of membrane protease activity|nr:NfeD family protein [Rhodoferax sp.]MBK7549598.1 NfeD family protein [Rhodoferax sp.]
MAPSTLWWLLAGAAIALELLTGTFYLLMLALGMAGAAVAAHLGAGTVVQLLIAAGVGGGAVAVWHQLRKKRPSDPSARAQRSVNLDVGETVQIEAWNPDGTAAVKYRGANWTAIHRTGVSPSAGAHRVSELVGNRLLVDKL